MGGTQIKITPPGGTEQEIKVYDRCTVTLSATNQVGSFSLEIPDLTGDLIDSFPIGSDVWIRQGDHVFRGWILNPTKGVDGQVKTISISGLCYTGRTQKIVVTENYEDWEIGDIVSDLFTKYMPDLNQDNIVACDKVISIKFKEKFLFDCMEELCALAGYEWVIFEPLPEAISTGMESSGWVELIERVEPIQAIEEFGWQETVAFLTYYPPRPADDLYPAEDLYPG